MTFESIEQLAAYFGVKNLHELGFCMTDLTRCGAEIWFRRVPTLLSPRDCDPSAAPEWESILVYGIQLIARDTKRTVGSNFLDFPFTEEDFDKTVKNLDKYMENAAG
jgi:hypothetical protein